MSINFGCSCRIPQISPFCVGTHVHVNRHMCLLPSTYTNRARGVSLAELVKSGLGHNLWAWIQTWSLRLLEYLPGGKGCPRALSSCPWTHCASISKTGRSCASYSTGDHQDPCGAGCRGQLSLGIYPLPPAHCKASALVP